MTNRIEDDPVGVPQPESAEVKGGRENQAKQFRSELESLLNRYSCENGSNTPDFILAGFLIACLASFDLAVRHRATWNGQPVGMISIPPQMTLTTGGGSG